MQISIHLMDGRKYPFTIAGDKAGAAFLERVKYWEIFDQPILRIHDGKDTWCFNPGLIEKILFLTTDDPGWRPPDNIIASKSIALETYKEKLKAFDARPQPTADQFEQGKFIEALVEITLASGTIDYFESYIMLRQRREQMINLHNLFQRLGYAVPCETGGYMLLNPRHIASIHFHPGIPEDQDSAWLVDEFNASTSA